MMNMCIVMNQQGDAYCKCHPYIIHCGIRIPSKFFLLPAFYRDIYLGYNSNKCQPPYIKANIKMIFELQKSYNTANENHTAPKQGAGSTFIMRIFDFQNH